MDLLSRVIKISFRRICSFSEESLGCINHQTSFFFNIMNLYLQKLYQADSFRSSGYHGGCFSVLKLWHILSVELFSRLTYI